VSALLADRTLAPTTLLDRTGRIVLCNRTMEDLLGRSRLELSGRDWVEELAPPDQREVARVRLAEALRGTIKRCECPVRLAGEAEAILTLDVERVGHAGHETLLASVVRVHRPTNKIDHQGIVELRYQISTDAHDFGRIRRVQSADAPIDTSHLVGERCFKAIHRRDSPCVDCPALAPGGGGRKTAVVISGWDDAPFAVVTADPSRDGTRQMTAQFVGPSVTTGLMRARVQSLAEAGGLSVREREVLNLLLLGRTYREIGRALDIGERTVKYHQGNILEKLGADSRLDLVRLFF